MVHRKYAVLVSIEFGETVYVLPNSPIRAMENVSTIAMYDNSSILEVEGTAVATNMASLFNDLNRSTSFFGLLRKDCPIQSSTYNEEIVFHS